MELTEYITDLLVDFDEMGFAPTTTVPNPEAYAIEWRNKITKAFEELTEENERVRAIPEQLHKEMSERMVEERKIERKLTVRKMQERVKEKAYTNNYCQKVVLVDDIDQIAKEMLENN